MTVTYKFKYTWHKPFTALQVSYRNYNDKAKFERINHGIVIKVEEGSFKQEEFAI